MPTADSGIQAAPGPRIVLRWERAGLGSRLLAGFVDHLVFLSILGIGWQLLHPQKPDLLLYRNGGLVVYALFFAAQEVLFGRTLGKATVGLILIDPQGVRPSARSVLVRNLARLPWAWPLFLLPDLCLLAFDQKARRIGDLLGNTQVVYAPEH